MQLNTKPLLAAGALALVASTPFASNHREAPITALDEKADITDFYAFVSYDEFQVAGEQPEKVTFVLCVDPLLEPGNVESETRAIQTCFAEKRD